MAEEEDDMNNSNSKSGGKRKTQISHGGKIGGLIVVVVVGFLTAVFFAKRNKRGEFNDNPSLHGKSPKACNEVNINKEERGSRGLRCLLQDYHLRDHGDFSTIDIVNDEKHPTEIEITVPEKEIVPLQVAEYATLGENPVQRFEDNKDVAEHFAETENENSKDTASCSYASTMAELEAFRLGNPTTFEITHNRFSSYSAFNQTTDNTAFPSENIEHLTLKICASVFSILALSLISMSNKFMFVALFFSMMFKAVCKKIG